MKELYEKSIKGYPKFDLQFDGNSFELTLAKVFDISEKGSLDFSDNERVIPETTEIAPVKKSEEDKYGWWRLEKGVYKILFNETLELPEDFSADLYTRKSLLDCGAYAPEIRLEKGYKGDIHGILVIENPKGIDIKQNARICKLRLISS